MSDAATRFALRAAAGRLLNRVRLAYDQAGEDQEVSQDNPLPVAIISGGGGGGGGGGGDASAANQTAALARQGTLADAAVTDPAAAASQIAAAKGLLALAGAQAEAAPASDTAASGLNGRLQRIAQRLTAILAQLLLATGTRPYNFAAGQRITTTGAGQVRSAAIAAAEVTLVSSVRGFFRVGNASVVATIGPGSFPLPADLPFTLQITSGQFISFIRDGASDGSLSIMPVA